MKINYLLNITIFISVIFGTIACGGGDSNMISSKSLLTENEDNPKDMTPPTIKLKDNNPLNVLWKSNFVDPGVEITDNVDRDIELNIISDVNTSVIRDFNITYIATDKSGNSARAVRVVHIYRTKEQIENITQIYKIKWFDKAVEKYNATNPEYPWTEEYFSYKFPDDADFEAGNPPDKPLTSKEWVANAGVGFTKKISLPKGPYSYDENLIKEWEKRGIVGAGRFHISFQQQLIDESDPEGRRLDPAKLKVLKDACELFTNAGMPVVISTGGDMTSDTLNNDWVGTFDKEINYWRQLAEYFKDVSHLLAFENFIECHAFNKAVAPEWYLRLNVDNNETRFPQVTWKGKTVIDNHVESLGYNNLNAEIAKVVRVTNPKRVLIYKPGGTGRNGMGNITPYRWGSEPDYLDGDDFYWVISGGGAANMRTSYIYALRESNATKREQMISSAKAYSWGPILGFYQNTQLPIWISLFGIKTEDESITGDEVASYINWYLDSVQSSAYNKKTMKRTRIATGFQQSWWLWHFGIKKPYWKTTVMYDWNVSKLVDAFGSHAFGEGITPKYYPPLFLDKTKIIKRDGIYVGGEFNSTIFYEAISDKEDTISFKKISGANWLKVLSNGDLRGVPTIDDSGENNFTVAVVGKNGDIDKKELIIDVDRYQHIDSIVTDDAMCKKHEPDDNFGEQKSENLRVASNRYGKVAYFKFDIDVNKSIQKAYFSIDISSRNGSNLNLYLVKDNSWSEDSITWNNKPKDLEKIATLKITNRDKKYIEFDISSIVKSNGIYSFRLESIDNDANVDFKESQNPPKIILEVE